MSLFKLTSNGKCTIMELDGKTIGSGIEAVTFTHDVTKDKRHQVMLHLDMALSDYSDSQFLADGRYDEISQMMVEPQSKEAGSDSDFEVIKAGLETMHASGNTQEHRKSCGEASQPHNIPIPQ